ncbi:MAG TPA: hypothetical protein VNQ97_14440, partial [Burkholderiaceae bacterium]|nr:hypothetical protein [Burkholderiaceae bacterium]
MTSSTAFRENSARKLASTRGRLIYIISFYVIPASIVIFSLLALFTLTDRYPFTRGTALEFQLLADPDGRYAPETALAELTDKPPVLSAEATSPSWFLVNVPLIPALGESAIDIPARLAQTLACWNADTLEPLGDADRGAADGSLRLSKLGFAAMLGRLQLPMPVLCRATFAQSSPLSVELWSITDLRKSTSRFDRGMGMLEGGLLTIALFIVVIALTNREWVYLLLAAWLVG